MKRISWDSDEVDPTEPVKASAARGSAPYSAALGPALTSMALQSQGEPLRLSAAAGSGNFTFRVPVAHYPGRGNLPLVLDLVYNSRIWQRTGDVNPKMVFDIDDDWPAPGWSLHFGKVVRVGRAAAMFVEPDGTRHPFKVDHTAGSGAGRLRMTAHTTDGSGITYSFIEHIDWRNLVEATVLRPDGTSIEFHNRTQGRLEILYAERTTDANGNTITITYNQPGSAQIATVTDTCGRVVRFGYSEDDMTGRALLYNVSGPVPGQPFGDTVRERELVRFSIGGTALRYSFADEVAYAPLLKADALRAIFMPATGTGFWFPDGSYSTYGMLKRVTACRGMSIPGAGQPNAGKIQQGPVSWVREYDYPDAGAVLTDSPTYTTLTESWKGQVGGPAVTRFQVQPNDAGDSRSEITWPDGAKTISERKGTAGQTPAGLLSELTVLDPDGRKLQLVKTKWTVAANGTPQVEEIQNINGRRGGLVKTTFAYGPEATLPTIIDQWDYNPSNTVLRRTHTDYVQDAGYLNRNLRNLPKTVRVFEPFDPWSVPPPTLVPASWTEYQYDRPTPERTPGIIGWDERFDSQSPSYSTATIWRGNVTTIHRFADAAQRGGLVSEYRTYDQCGNLRTSNTGAGSTQWLYRPEARYMAPSAVHLAASNPGVATRLEVSATSYFSDGQPRLLTDANGQRIEIQYDAGGRVRLLISQTTGATVAMTYDDAELTQTRIGRESIIPSRVTSEEVQTFDGHGRLLSVRTAKPGGWVVVDYEYDLRGRLKATSVPHEPNDATHWTTTTYDALHRAVRRTDPDGGVTSWYYDEVAHPENAWDGWNHSTVRITDPCGRERWVRFDAMGRVQDVVEPLAESAGRVLPSGGSRTEYRYDGNDNVTEISKWKAQSRTRQRRVFLYDSLSRLVRVLLPECGEGVLEVAGVVRWSFAMAYDERSNLISSKDSRGVIVRYQFSGDPLDRLQQISYDVTKVTDAASVVLPCQPVQYTYVTTGDIRRVETETVVNLSQQSFSYDPFAGLISTTVTLAGVDDFPFTVDYSHDMLGRATGCVYPALYGDGGAPRPSVAMKLGVGNLPIELAVDGVQHASNIVYGPTGRVKSIMVGAPGAERGESYDYYPSGDLKGQQLYQLSLAHGVPARLTLLDLSYGYRPATFGFGLNLTRQLAWIRDLRDAAGSRDYDYDALGRLTIAGNPRDPWPSGAVEPAWTWVQDYDYDLHGNRTLVSVRGEVEPGKPAATDGVAALSFNEANRITTDGFNYDAAGNLVSVRAADGTDYGYQYDAAGRLALVKNMQSGALTKYVYGACNRRRATLAIAPGPGSNPDPANPTSLTSNLGTIESAIFYVWDGNTVIATYDDTGPTIGKTLVWKESSVFLGTRLLSRRENADAAGSSTWYEHPGLTGTRYVTGPVGGGDHEPFPFGSTMVRDGGASRPFTTYAHDRRTGLDYAVNRFYHPQLGRFLQPDPLGAASFQTLNPQSLNLYSYCGNDPVNRTDPLGLLWCIFGDCSSEGGGGVLIGPTVTVIGYEPLQPPNIPDPNSGWSDAHNAGGREGRIPGRGSGQRGADRGGGEQRECPPEMVRSIDYWSWDVAFIVAFHMGMDKFGNVYVGLGLGTPGVSLRGGQLEGSRPATMAELQSFNTAHAVNYSVGWGISGGVTGSPGNRQGIEFGVGTPGIGVSYTYSVDSMQALVGLYEMMNTAQRSVAGPGACSK